MPKFTYILRSSYSHKPAFFLGRSQSNDLDEQQLVQIEDSVSSKVSQIEKARDQYKHNKHRNDEGVITTNKQTGHQLGRISRKYRKPIRKSDFSVDEFPRVVGSDEMFGHSEPLAEDFRPSLTRDIPGVFRSRFVEPLRETYEIECIEHRFDRSLNSDEIAIWSDDIFDLMENLQAIRSYLKGAATPQLDQYVQKAEEACDRTINYLKAIRNELLDCECELSSFIANYKYIISRAIKEFKAKGFDEDFNKDMILAGRKHRYFRNYVNLCEKLTDGFKDMIDKSHEDLAQKIFDWECTPQNKLSRCNIVRYLESLIHLLEPSRSINASLKMKLNDSQVQSIYKVLVSYDFIDASATSLDDMYYFCTGKHSAPMNKIVWQSSIVDLVNIMKNSLECNRWKSVSEIFMYYEGNSILPTNPDSLKSTSHRLNAGVFISERTRQIADIIKGKLSA